MAIIDCPSCSKKVSDKAEQCPHCQLDLTGLDEEKLENIKRINIIKRSQALMTQSFLSLLLFCAGILFFFWQQSEPSSIQYIGSITASALGFVLYIITRIRIILLKKSLK